MKLGLGLGLTKRQGGGAAVSITINGLTGGNAVVGDHASITMSASSGTITARKWGSTPGGSEYGTGTSPTDYTAGEGGALYATATVDSVDYSASASIVFAAPVATGGIADQSYAQDSAISTLDVSSDFTGSGITYALAPSSAALPAGLSLASNGQITGTPTAEAAQVNIVVRGTNSGGFDDTAFGVTITAASAAIPVSFGALTLAGAGGVAKPAGATSISNAGGTNLVLSSGFAVPDTGGTVTSGTVTWDDGTEWTVSAVANTYSAKADKTEIEAAHAAASTSATTTCLVREGTTSSVISLTGKTFTGSFTLKGEGFATNSAARPSGYSWGVQLGGIDISGAEIHITELEVFAPKAGTQANGAAIQNENSVAISDFSITKCEIHSTPMETHVEQMLVAGDPQISQQVAGINMYEGGSNGLVEDCYIHDTRYVLKANIDNFLVQGVESEDTVEGWIVSGNAGATGMIIKNCEHHGMWASIDDPGDQHSGMGGGDGVLGGSNAGKLIGCVVSNAGWKRRDYEASQGRTTYYPYGVGGSAIDMNGTTGFKLNDPNPKTANGYDGWEIKHNIFLCESTIGMTVENGKNIDWAYNTIVGDAESGNGSPMIYADDQNVTGTYYTDSGPLRAWKNLSGGIQMNGLHTEAERTDASRRAYDNIQIINGATVQSGVTSARAYDEYFVGDGVKGFEKLTPVEMIAAFAPKTGTYADTANVGAVNDYYTIGIPGKGSTDTSPAYDQPTSANSATANGHSYSRTVWDGTVGLELDNSIQAGALTSDGTNLVTNGKQLLIVGQFEMATGTESTNMMLYQDGSGGITLSRNGVYDCFSFTWNRPSDSLNVVRFDSLAEIYPSNGVVSFAISVDLGNDRACIAINGKAVTAFNRITTDRLFNDDTGDFQATNVHLLEDTAGSNRFEGKLDFFGVDNSFVDLETDAGLETLFAADGTLLDLTSAGYLVALAGNAAAFNGDTGNSNGAAQAALATGAGSVTDDDTTAPTLSSATDAADGSTASTGSVSTNEGNGTLYWVVTTSATAPSAAQVKAGQDNSGSAATADGSQAVSGTGVQTLSPAPSGLTASTSYTTHFMHEDASGNQSAVASASGFTTDSGSNVDEGSSTASFTSSGGYRVAEMTDGETLVVSTGFTPTGIEMVGGGGGGGGRIGGGGGAGELIQINSSVPSLSAQTYTATVGAGGLGDDNGAGGSDGGNTRLIGGITDDLSLTALGGGEGGRVGFGDGVAGGSGGGATGGSVNDGGLSTASDGVGYAGGDGVVSGGGSGGGGAAAIGGNDGGTGTGGAGGAGVTSICPGKSDTLSKGGDGGPTGGSVTGAPATGIGTGGNGGSGSFGYRVGSDGTSGIIRVWWPE